MYILKVLNADFYILFEKTILNILIYGYGLVTR